LWVATADERRVAKIAVEEDPVDGDDGGHGQGRDRVRFLSRPSIRDRREIHETEGESCPMKPHNLSGLAEERTNRELEQGTDWNNRVFVETVGNQS
jgi:hypothetical protein